jgi:hypothetical protein
LIGGLSPRETKGANINCLDERYEQHAVSLTSGRHTRAQTNLAGMRSKIRSRSMICRHSLLQLPGLDHASPADGVAAQNFRRRVESHLMIAPRLVTPRSSPAFSSSWMRAPAGSNCFTSLALSFAECVSPESTSLSSSLSLRFAAACGHYEPRMPTEFSGTRDEKYAATTTGGSYVPGWVRRTVVGGLNKNARMHIWGHSTSNASAGWGSCADSGDFHGRVAMT